MYITPAANVKIYWTFVCQIDTKLEEKETKLFSRVSSDTRSRLDSISPAPAFIFKLAALERESEGCLASS